MPRNPEQILIDADDWRSVALTVGRFHALVAEAADACVSASAESVARVMAGDPFASAEVLAEANAGHMAKLAEIQNELAPLLDLATARITTLRVEVAELMAEHQGEA